MSPVLLTVKASPVNKGSFRSDISNINTIITTTDRNPKRPNRYTTTLQIYRQLVKAWQTIWFILKKHVRIYHSNVINYCIIVILVKLYNFLQETTAQAPFEYCFLKNIANPPNNNLTVRIVHLNMGIMSFVHFI